MTVRVLIVDDQGMVRAGFAAYLGAQDDLQVIGEAADGAEAVRRAVELAPDVILMDVRMPVTDGIAATRAILAGADRSGQRPSKADASQPPERRSRSASEDRGVAPKVLVLTTFDLDEHVYAGASGFLLKDTSATELADAVRVVAAGDAVISPVGDPPASMSSAGAP